MRIKQLKNPLLFLSFSLFSALSFATSTSQMSFTELVRSSHACVVATAIGTEYVEENGSVFTYTTFEINETAFGSTADVIKVKTPGGERKLGRLLTSDVVPGSPRFFSNQESVLFLKQANGTNQYLVNGFSEGVRGVRQSSSGPVVELRTTGEVSVDQAVDEIQELRTVSK